MKSDNDRLKALRERIMKDGVEETLAFIKSANIKGPTFEEMFGYPLDLGKTDGNNS